MKKTFLRIISFIFCFVLLFSSSTIVYAADFFPETEIVGVLTTEDGTQHIIKGELVSNNANTRTALPNDYYQTYKFNIPAEPKAGGGDSTIYDEDPHLTSTVYSTISYITRNNSLGEKEYLLTGVSGYWIITDPKTIVESAEITYGCSIVHQSSQSVTRTVRNSFNYSTGFTQYVKKSYTAVLGMNMTIDYLLGNNLRWSFTLENNLFNEPAMTT